MDNDKLIIRSNITYKELVREYKDDINYWTKLSYSSIALGILSGYLEYKYFGHLYKF